MTELWTLALLGGALGSDATAVGQFMVSRPIVAGAIAGWLVGDPVLGVTIGAILELYLLVSFPTGGARFPEGATATVVAVGCAAVVGGSGAVPLAVAVGLAWGQVGGASIVGQRHLNVRLVPEPGGGARPSRTLTTAHAAAIGLDFLRGCVVTGVGVVVGRTGVGLAARAWPLDEPSSMGLVLVGGAVSAGILLRDVGGLRARGAWFAAGLAVGLVGMRFL